MAKRVTVTMTVDVDEGRVSTDFYDAKEDVEMLARQFGAEIGEVKAVRVALLGWTKPSYERY